MTRYVYGGRKAIVSTYFRRRASADVRQPAQVLAAQAGQLHHQLLPAGQKPSLASTMTSSICPPIDPQYGKPFLVAATSGPCSTTGRRPAR